MENNIYDYGSTLVIILDSDVEILHMKNSKTNKKILLVKKKKKSKFVKLDKSPKYRKEFKKRTLKVQPSITKKNFYELNPEDWRPKHVVQYVRNKFKIIYNEIPLELQWDENKYSKAKSRNLAYAKHLLDKLNKLKIPNNRIKHYIDWCFDKKNIPATLPLLSCNNWIDSYYYDNKDKRIRQSKTYELVKLRTEMWEGNSKDK